MARNFDCTICEEDFRNYLSLQKHIIKDHGISDREANSVATCNLCGVSNKSVYQKRHTCKK